MNRNLVIVFFSSVVATFNPSLLAAVLLLSERGSRGGGHTGRLLRLWSAALSMAIGKLSSDMALDEASSQR